MLRLVVMPPGAVVILPVHTTSLYEAGGNLKTLSRPIAIASYINFMPEDEVDRVEAAYGGNYRRLAEVKRRYDPQNLFRMNQNVI